LTSDVPFFTRVVKIMNNVQDKTKAKKKEVKQKKPRAKKQKKGTSDVKKFDNKKKKFDASINNQKKILVKQQVLPQIRLAPGVESNIPVQAVAEADAFFTSAFRFDLDGYVIGVRVEGRCLCSIPRIF